MTEEQWATLTPGEAIKELRSLHHMTQADLAERVAGVTSKTISRIERGEVELSISVALKISKVFKVHPAIIAFPSERYR